MTLDLEPAAHETARIAGAVRDDQLDNPTPCADLDVRGLLAHIVGLGAAFRDAAAKVDGPTTSTPPGPADLSADWRDQLPRRLHAMAAAWRDPDAWIGDTTVGGVTSPAPQAAAFGNNELVVHGWDLAVATGQPYRPAPANLQASFDLVSSVPDDPDARRGLFGPAVPVPDTASLLDRTLGGCGRDPRWSATSTS